MIWLFSTKWDFAVRLAKYFDNKNNNANDIFLILMAILMKLYIRGYFKKIKIIIKMKNIAKRLIIWKKISLSDK